MVHHALTLDTGRQARLRLGNDVFRLSASTLATSVRQTLDCTPGIKTDEKLRQLAEEINVQAKEEGAEGEEGDEGEEEQPGKARGAKARISDLGLF